MSEIFTPNVDIVRLANSTVYASSDKTLKLGQVWQKQPAIIIFLRHFACIACRAHAQTVWEKKEEYESKGGRIVFLGNGAPQFIETFREDLQLGNSLILTDPSLESFRAAGFRHGFFYVVQVPSIVNAVKLATGGHRQTSYSKEAGTHWQLGGIVVVKTSGDIAYHYISESLGDFPDEPHFEKIVDDEKNRKLKESQVLY